MDFLLYQEYIQWGFGGAFLLIFILLCWVLKSHSRERKEFRTIINDTQHDTIEVMKCNVKSNEQVAKSNQKLSRALGRFEKSIDSIKRRGKK